jgi:Skp family chaperone for outer membrane proteins
MTLPPFRARAARFAAMALAAFAFAAAPALAQQQQQQPQQRQAPAQPRPAAPAAAPAAASELPARGTAVVFLDIDAVMRQSTAMQNINTQAERQRTALQNDAQRQENELRRADEELATQRNVLSQDAFNQRRRQFEDRVAAAQQQIQNRRRNLEQSYADAAGRVQQALTAAVEEVMNENEYQMVLPNSVLFMARSALDISGEVSRRLNRRLPTASMAN